MNKEKELLKSFGCYDIVIDPLVNNYFITFVYNYKEYKVEHTLNVYGASVDYWELFEKSRTKIFPTLEELLNYIK